MEVKTPAGPAAGGFKIVNDIQPIGRPRQRGQRRIADRYLHRSVMISGSLAASCSANPLRCEGSHKHPAGPIPARQLRRPCHPLTPHHGIVDLHARSARPCNARWFRQTACHCEGRFGGGALRTFSTRAAMLATLPSCSRMKVMPESASAGPKVSVADSPEKSPGRSGRLRERWFVAATARLKILLRLRRNRATHGSRAGSWRFKLARIILRRRENATCWTNSDVKRAAPLQTPDEATVDGSARSIKVETGFWRTGSQFVPEVNFFPHPIASRDSHPGPGADR